MDKWQKCPLIENCQQKSAVCNVQLPDETCYWFRWFRALDNPWHTGTPTEEGWYLLECNIGNSDETYYVTDHWNNEVGYWTVNRVIRWQKITPYKEKEDGRTD